MKRILAAVLLYCTISTPVLATPVYTGVQFDDTTTSVLLGYQINDTYRIEAHYSESESSIDHAGIRTDSKSSSTGIAGIARFRMKLRKKVPYYLFLKAGYEHIATTETYSVPASVTLTLRYRDEQSDSENRLIFGGGAEYYFTRHLIGRTGVDFLGADRSVYLAAIYKF